MPTDFFRDNIWQFWGVVVGIIALIVAVVLFLLERRRKKLAYEIIGQSPVILATDKVAVKIELLVDGKLVTNAHFLVLKLINTGEAPIPSTDYEREVSFNFSHNVKILTVDASESIPENLHAEASIVNQSIVVKPLLLNGKDAIIIKSFVSNFDNKINIDGRVIGVKKIEKISQNSSTRMLVILNVLNIVFTGFIAFLVISLFLH